MAAEDKKISVLTEWIYGSIQDAANIVVAHVGSNYRIALSTLKQYVLGDREIGGTGSSDIVTTTDRQTLTQKRLDSPSFNNDVELNSNVTATQMNFLQNLDVNVKQKFDVIASDILGVENSVENLISTVGALQADKIYSASHAAISTSITLTASEIGGGEEIDAHSLSISVYMKPNQLSLRLVNLSNIHIAFTVDTPPSSKLTNVTIADVEPEKIYHIIIRYRVIA